MVGSAGAGGAETFAVRLIAALSRVKGLDVRVVARRGGWLGARLRDCGVVVEEVPFGGLFDWRTAGMVRRIAKDFKPQVVQSWMNRATRFVPRGPWATVGRLGGFYDLKYYRGRVANLVGNTQAIVDYCVAEGWAPQRVELISNFVPEPAEGWRDVRDEVRARLKMGAHDKVLMMAGRLHKVKGVDVALRALQKLGEGHVLLLAGEGPLRAELEALAAELSVAARVRWVGWADDVSPYAAVADVWLAPSRHEPLGNTVLDAWVHCVPVVAARTGGLAMLVDDGVSGLLVDVGDDAALAAAVKRLLTDKKLRAAVVKGGRARFDRDFCEDVIVARYVAYYKGLVKEKGSKA
jgi:glycosyltransferase involved in cell wall biosynthesis